MTTLTWLTDIHLNFLDYDERTVFYQQIIKASGDAVVITGDICEAQSVAEVLMEMAQAVQKPIYFVLGNHDYYHGSVSQVRSRMEILTEHEALLNWLPASGPQDLGDQTVLLGEDGWADGRYGDYTNSQVVLNDSRLIQDLFHGSILGKYPLLEAMQKLADRDAARLKSNLQLALDQHHPKKIIILTHVPPFKEACYHEGKMSNDDFLPFFSSKATGDVIMEMAKAHSDINFYVLCGHSHCYAYWQGLDNLIVKAGDVVYGKPDIQDVIKVNELFA